MSEAYEVVHFIPENHHNVTMCGKRVSTHMHTTDIDAEMEDREGSRCKLCWRTMSARKP